MNQNQTNRNDKNKITLSVQIINVFIGVIITLICSFAYFSIEDVDIRWMVIVLVVFAGVMFFINTINKNKVSDIDDKTIINNIALVNEDNDIIKEWDISDKTALLIGKSTVSTKVDIDLNSSIYSMLIEDEHAVLNYAGGRWYVEDISYESAVSIEKAEDNKKYRILKNTPCTLKKGDILFVSKIKLLLR